MLVLCNSMCKSASSVLFWYTRELVAAQLENSAQKELRRLTDIGELPGRSEFVYPVTDEVFERLLQVSRTHGPLVVKTHNLLTDRLRVAISNDEAKTIFSYRDPRDMILSAIDHRRRTIESNKRLAFEEFTSVKESIRPAVWWCRMACDWVESRLPLRIAYSEVVKHPAEQIAKVAKLLDLDVDESMIQSLLECENKNRATGNNEFNKGDLIRYPNEMTPEEIFMCDRQLGAYIRRLGFFVNPAHVVPRKPLAIRKLRAIRKIIRQLPFSPNKRSKNKAA